MKKTIKEFRSQFDGKLIEFELTKKTVYFDTVKGVKLIRSYWAALEGFPQVLEFICDIPDGYNDLDFDSLKTDCLIGSEDVNEDALLK